MKLTNPEKLILLMLSDIYDKLELDSIDTRLLRSAIYTENTWALDWEMPGVVGSEPDATPEIVKKVLNYLEMWAFIEEAVSSFTPDESAQLERIAAPFGRYVRFPGFDGNNESEELGIARILIDDMGRFTRFKGRDLNSHAPLQPAYERMYRVFSNMQNRIDHRVHLSVDQVADILNAVRPEGEA
ncbi:YfbU family protein [Comamonas testosteroni]|uniref:YfbU family protein n=1 Tax=Comamonas testosteroni TaxID=285 RepID=UPI0006B96A80|nr:YfbU family protein [Comamonas testosteroni]